MLENVEKLEMISTNGFLKFDLNHKLTNRELNALDTLVFDD